MKLFEFSKALPDGDLQETRTERTACLHKKKPRFSRSSLSKTRTTVTLANCDVNQKGGRERPNEPAVPNHCPGLRYLNEGAGPHLSTALPPTSAFPEGCEELDSEKN